MRESAQTHNNIARKRTRRARADIVVQPPLLLLLLVQTTPIGNARSTSHFKSVFHGIWASARAIHRPDCVLAARQRLHV
jgi:hypothetical protein